MRKVRTAVVAGVAAIGLGVGVLSSCAGNRPATEPAPAPSASAPAAAGETITASYEVQLFSDQLYPAASWLPPAYQADFPSLTATIQHFTEQSLQRDGIRATVQVKALTQKVVVVIIAGTDPRIAGYRTMHPQFFDPAHAGQALSGVTKCQNTPNCWCTDPNGCSSGTTPEPWAMFLPLGLPLVNQRGLLFLDYPPASSLTVQNKDGTHGDYLNNFTMCRWHNVIVNSGSNQPYLYETIVDARPIAAPGSKLTKQLPDAITYFNSPGNLYLAPMINLLGNPPSNTGSNNLPVAVLGSPARTAWQAMIGGSPVVGVLTVSSSTLAPGTRSTPWIGGNHPDVTSYQCCPGDPSSSCSGSPTSNQCINSNGLGYDLIACETVDFTVSCFEQSMAANPTQSPTSAKQACNARWTTPIASQADALSFCIQAKLDNQNSAARCPDLASAQAYCQAHQNNACATLDCGAVKGGGYPCTQMPQTP